MKARLDITLSSGAVVRHELDANGSQRARINGRIHGGMTEAEFAEYVQLLKQSGEVIAYATPPDANPRP